MNFVSKIFIPAPIITSTYLAKLNFNDSQLSELCKLPPTTQTNVTKTTFAWNYFSSNVTAADYKNRVPSKLKRTFTMTLPGAILAVARIIYDIFFCIYKLLSSSPSALQNIKRLGICLGRDVAQLASYIALPFTDRALPWIAHHELQRTLLFKDTPEKIQQHLLLEIVINRNSKALRAFEELYKDDQERFVCLLLKFNSTDVKRIINMMPSFIKNFNAEYWTNNDKFSKILELASKVPDYQCIIDISEKLIEKEKYREFSLLFNKTIASSKYPLKRGDYFSENFQQLFTKLKEKHGHDAVEIANAVMELFKEDQKDEKERFFKYLCNSPTEEETAFALPLLAQTDEYFQNDALSRPPISIKPLSTEQIKLLETPVKSKTINTELLPQETIAFCQIQRYIHKGVQEKILCNLLYSYCHSGDVKKVLNILEEKFPSPLNKEDVLKTVLTNIYKPVWQEYRNSVVVPPSTLWQSLSLLFTEAKDENLNVILIRIMDSIYLPKIENDNIEKIKIIYELLIKILSDDKVRVGTKAFVARLSYHCLSAIGKKEQDYFNDKLTALMPHLIDSLMSIDQFSKKNHLGIHNYFFKEKDDKNLSTTVKKCITTILEKDLLTPEMLKTALEITKLLDDEEKNKYVKDILDVCFDKHKKSPELLQHLFYNIDRDAYLSIYKDGLLLLKEEKDKIECCGKIIDWCLEKDFYFSSITLFEKFIMMLPKKTAKTKLKNKIEIIKPKKQAAQIELLNNLIQGL